MRNISPPVFYYHSVAPEQIPGWVLRFLTLKLEVFESEMRYLEQHGFRSVFLNEWLDIRQGRSKCTGRELCLSLDDGLLDNWVYAFPMAKKYGQRLTLFIPPEYTDPRNIVRPNLDDVWAGRYSIKDLDIRGHMSWEELRLMQASGWVDVQSHTMTHAKYICSARLQGFYYGGVAGLHSILNTHSHLKPFYMADPDFQHRLPWGAPLFEERSAAVARIHHIHPGFMQQIQQVRLNYNMEEEAQRRLYEVEAKRIYEDWLRSDRLTYAIETEEEYLRRMRYEIHESKSTLENKLDKPVEFLCWPHGDVTVRTHEMAKKAGYRATTSGKQMEAKYLPDRIPRTGAHFTHGPLLARVKMHYKIQAHYRKQPYYYIWLANEIKNRWFNSL